MSRGQIGQTVGLAVVVILAAALLLAVVLNSRPASGAAGPAPMAAVGGTGAANTISVVGQGSAGTTPDQATVGLGVAATRGNVNDALSAAGADLASLLKSLHGEGVQDKDIQTTGLSVGQENFCCPRNVTGYSASSQVSVTVHHVANVGPLVATAVAAVGNEIQLNGVSLSVSDTTAQAKAARAAAMVDAGVRANQWAALAGHRLGGIVSVSEAPLAAQYPAGCCGYGAGGGGIPILAGQSQVTMTITVVYELVA